MTQHRIALVYAYGPSGHSRAAAALREQMLSRDPETSVDSIELAEDVHRFLGPLVSKTYLELVQRTPKLWDYLYDNAFVADALQEFRETLSHWHRRKLRDRLGRSDPDAIVCTHALPCATLAIEKERGSLSTPLVGVLTDFGVHAYWPSPRVDLYIAPTEESRRELVRRGVPEPRVRVCGIPLSPRFARPPGKDEARRRLGLRAELPVALVSGGASGLGPLRDIASRLSRDIPGLQALVVCGRNSGLARGLRAKYASSANAPRRVAVLDFVEDMETCLAAADVLVGKAGGLTAAEAMASGVPMVILSPLPGQEERNSSYLAGRGAAMRAEDLDEMVGAVRSLLNSPGLLDEMRSAARTLGRPDSAQAACREILDLLPAESNWGHARIAPITKNS